MRSDRCTQRHLPKCNQVSAADSIVAMPRMTAKLFREILDSIEGDIETLEIEKTVTEGEDVPTQAERSASSASRAH